MKAMKCPVCKCPVQGPEQVEQWIGEDKVVRARCPKCGAWWW